MLRQNYRYFVVMAEEFYGRDDYMEGDFYFTKEGYRVFTEQYLLRRGYCCKNTCRHCPYGFNPKTGTVNGNRKGDANDK